MNTKTKIPLTEKLIEFELCSSNGHKMREKKILYYLKKEPIPDEKWLLTQKICNLEDLGILANKALVDYKNWQKIFEHHTISDLVKKYEDHKDDVSVKKILERVRDNAWWDNAMALFSSIAYRDEYQIKAILKAFGFKDNDILPINEEKTDTHGFLCRFKTNEEKTITIHTWRGTVSRRNWLTNFNTGLLARPISILNSSTSSSDGTVSKHRGIEGALESSLPKILDFLNSEPDTINVLTGHSLGGGLANACVPF